eukprot:323551-Chlamydomonas_euryale.AAC.1
MVPRCVCGCACACACTGLVSKSNGQVGWVGGVGQGSWRGESSDERGGGGKGQDRKGRQGGSSFDVGSLLQRTGGRSGLHGLTDGWAGTWRDACLDGWAGMDGGMDMDGLRN